jgi:SOS-response transcriptional repressor LexA
VATKEKKLKKPRFRDTPFLKQIGQHCQALRKKKGYSIDRLAKESERLSTSVIHRLETGESPVNLLAIFRYAQALGVHPKVLLDIELTEAGAESSPRTSKNQRSLKLVSVDDPRIKKERFKSLLPVYSLKAAAGYFGASEEVIPEGWIQVDGAQTLDHDMFVARAVGDSMLPTIRNGDLLVFRAQPSGSRQGKIVLVQYRGPADPETGGSYTVKQYQSSKSIGSDGRWHHKQITLKPLNPEYEPIVLSPQNENDFEVIAEFLFVLKK